MEAGDPTQSITPDEGSIKDYTPALVPDPGSVRDHIPSAPTKVGPLAGYLQQHFPNVAHYLGVTQPTPQEDAEFQRNVSEAREVEQNHPLLTGAWKAIAADPAPVPGQLSAGT